MEAWFDLLRLEESPYSSRDKGKGFKLVQKNKLVKHTKNKEI